MRIRAARSQAQLSTTKLGEMVGISNVSITRIELGQNKPAKRSLILIAQSLGNDFGLQWLRKFLRPSTAIPILGRVAAGKPIEAVPEADAEMITVPPEMTRKGKPTYALRVIGDSMIESLIQSGDLVVVQECPEPRNGTVVVAEIAGEVTLKTWKQKGSKVKLIPANPDYQEIEVEASQVKCLGEMIGLLRFVR